VLQFLATGFFVGRLGIAPGTLGTLIAVPILYIVSFNVWTILATAGILFALGLIASNEIIRTTGEKDPEEVVIDEMVGYMMCFLFVDPTFKNYLIAFVLFRVLDIFKPFPINLFERLPGAYGVMMDDLVAGVMTSFLMLLLLGR
jgi:phosphatidylglycerophosphatase A